MNKRNPNVRALNALYKKLSKAKQDVMVKLTRTEDAKHEANLAHAYLGVLEKQYADLLIKLKDDDNLVEAESRAGRQLTKREKELVRSGNLIQAIKAMRERVNVGISIEHPDFMGLKECKDVVDAYRASLPAKPEKRASFSQTESSFGGGD